MVQWYIANHYLKPFVFLDVFNSIFLVAQPFRRIFSAESLHDKDGISC